MIDPELRETLEARLNDHHEAFFVPKHSGDTSPAKISYGTAGFRGQATQIEPIFFNIGLAAGLRCLCLKASIGVMITASHNPIEDNGVKLIDPQGEMLEVQWEKIVEDICNTHQAEHLLALIDDLVAKFNIDLKELPDCKVILGMDTRPSSEALATLVKSGIEVWAPLVKYLDYHIVSTPALHYMVAETNTKKPKKISIYQYYDQLVSMVANYPGNHVTDFKLYSTSDLVVDCANGVGCETMRYLSNNEDFNKHLQLKLINTYEGILNRDCGADFVKTTNKPPLQANDTRVRYAALDGDADRLIYFYIDQEEDEPSLKLLDGDKILSLFGVYIRDQLEKSQLTGISFGIIQTAYANGASTDYITNTLKLKVDCVQTGVKNLHHQALKYDIAIYFEANGHGTVWISAKAKSIILARNDEASAELRHMVSTINNYTGDAVSDMLLVELILRHYDWDVQTWYQLYQDRPSSLIKIEVPDRTVIKTDFDDRTCIQPPEVQPAIDSIVKNFGDGARCFVRPSGTENVVRIYAEASEQEAACQLAEQVGTKLRKILG